MEEIINIIIKLIAIIIVIGMGCIVKNLTNKYTEYMNTEQDEKKKEHLRLFIAELVRAAEQMYKKDDPNGSERFEYVCEMLIDAGYRISTEVNAMIESEVFKINTIQKKGV